VPFSDSVYVSEDLSDQEIIAAINRRITGHPFIKHVGLGAAPISEYSKLNISQLQWENIYRRTLSALAEKQQQIAKAFESHPEKIQNIMGSVDVLNADLEWLLVKFAKLYSRRAIFVEVDAKGEGEILKKRIVAFVPDQKNTKTYIHTVGILFVDFSLHPEESFLDAYANFRTASGTKALPYLRGQMPLTSSSLKDDDIDLSKAKKKPILN